MSTFSPILLRSGSSMQTFKQVLLYIISAAQVSKEMHNKYKFEKVRGALSKYYNATKTFRTKEPRNSGGIDAVRDLKNIPNENIKMLINCYNKLTEPIPTASMYQDVAKNLPNILFQPNENADANLQRYITGINTYSYCQNLFDSKFPDIQDFKWSFVSEQEPSSPDIKLFATTKESLIHCKITLHDNLKIYSKDKETEEASNVEVVSKTLVEHYIGHYLNTDGKAMIAKVKLSWDGGKLKSMSMKQHEDLFGREGIGFINTENGIQDSIDNNPIFVLLQNDLKRTPSHITKRQFQQITIEKDEIDGVRRGTYSTVVQTILNKEYGREAITVSGLVILQKVTFEPDLVKLTNNLDYYCDYNKLSPGSLPKQILDSILSIRYQLQRQIISLPQSISLLQDSSWKRLQKYVGRYLCYYMRLSNSLFETSHIEIFKDGTATLEQNAETGTGKVTGKINGFVRIEGSRLWAYFGFNEQMRTSPIRFILDDVNAGKQLAPKLQGIFQSETIKTLQLVSGRMLLVKLPPKSPWPKFISIDPKLIKSGDFRAYKDEAENETRDNMLFFLGNSNLSDGPIWSEVSNRLLNHSALSIIERLCGSLSKKAERTQKNDESSNLGTFPNGQFYYYTFKRDGDNGPFLIERNFVSFKKNGTVTIQVSDSEIIYEGNAYYLNKTLRLSLSDSKGGFLEVFLELVDNRADLSAVKILYGMSLWHSGSRIQGKTVVLSRYESGPLNEKTEFFRFLEPGRDLISFKEENKRILDEDTRSGGAISYLRGEINRYMHATAHSSPEQFRPRDKEFREIYFLIACFYGYKLKEVGITEDEKRTIIEICKGILKQAFIHGYANDFAGLNINREKAVNDSSYIKQIYHERFPLIDINEDKTIKIIERIKQIAQEQIFLIKVFNTNGPLNQDDLRNYAVYFWPDLLN